MKKLPKFLALVALATGCGDIARNSAPPLDRFRYPVGLAVRHLRSACTTPPCSCAPGPADCQTVLHVVSSNFDLSFDTDEGGTLIAVRVPRPDEPRPANLGAQGLWAIPDILPLRLGAVRIGSFGGEVALLDDALCPGWESRAAPAAFVASRSRDRLYRITMDRAGGLSCGGDCRTALDPDLRDPYGVTVVCRGAGSAQQASVFTTYLTTPANIGFISELVVTPGGNALLAPINVGVDAARAAIFDPANDRLYFTGRSQSGPGYMPFRWFDLAFPPSGINPPAPIDMATRVYGAETTGFQLSTDGTRAYIGLRLYDGPTSASIGARTADIGGALAILDMTPSPRGGPRGDLVGLIPVGKGPSEVRVLPRRGMGPGGTDLADLVAVTCTGDGTVWFYDDETGIVPRVFSADEATGTPLLGRQPTGLAVEVRPDALARPGRTARVFVGSFSTHVVSVIRIDDLTDPRAAWVEMQIGMPQ